MLLRAYVAAGRRDDALREADWLAANRGRAYAEGNLDDIWQPTNVVESDLALLTAAELALAGGQKDLARQRLKSFDQAWPTVPELPGLRNRVSNLRQRLSVN
jgi:hypothetical protein